jgi:ribose transport system substrate-binding protein
MGRFGKSAFQNGSHGLSSPNRQRISAAALAVAALLAVSACSSSSKSDTSTSSVAVGSSTPAGSSSSASGDDALAPFQQALAAFEAPPKYDGPTDGPKPEAGKKISVITCAAQNTGCVAAANNVKEAGGKVGWDVTIYDGQGTPDGASKAMITAIGKGTDGIVLVAITSTAIIQGMTAAKNANIPVVSIVADNPVGSGSGEVYSEISGQTVKAGQAIADYFIVKSNGKAQVASFHIPGLASTVNRYKGFSDEIKKCAGCKIVSDQEYGIVTQAEFSNTIKATMNKNPSIQYIFVDVSQYATIAATAITQAGLVGKVGIAGIDCLPAEVQSIKDNTGEVACSNAAVALSGYATVNELTRAFAKLPALSEAYPLRLIDKAIIDADTTPYLGGFTPATGYLALWGKS